MVDTIAPIISPGDANIPMKQVCVPDTNASWSDAVDGTGVIVGGEVNASDGTYILSANHTDVAGNVAGPLPNRSCGGRLLRLSACGMPISP